MWYVYLITTAGQLRLPGAYRAKRDAESVAAMCRMAISNLVRVDIVKGLKPTDGGRTTPIVLNAKRHNG